MIEDGRAFGTTVALKHILAMLELKGILTHGERVKMLDEALGELDKIEPLTPEARAEAGRAIGFLYVK